MEAQRDITEEGLDFLKCIGYIIGISILMIVLYFVVMRNYLWLKRREIHKQMGIKKTIAFYHPFTNSWGGGEKVLFLALESILPIINEYKGKIKVIIYTVEEVDKETIIANAEDRFGIMIRWDFSLVRIKRRYFTDQTSQVKLNLISQAAGSIFSGIEALTTYPPDVFIDTIGVGFLYPFLKFLCPSLTLITYTHYPFIQQDMVNNAKTPRKKFYYNTMLFLYQIAGWFPDLILTNSSWTHNHICDIWRHPKITHILFPPCNTKMFSKLPLK